MGKHLDYSGPILKNVVTVIGLTLVVRDICVRDIRSGLKSIK